MFVTYRKARGISNSRPNIATNYAGYRDQINSAVIVPRITQPEPPMTMIHLVNIHRGIRRDEPERISDCYFIRIVIELQRE